MTVPSASSPTPARARQTSDASGIPSVTGEPTGGRSRRSTRGSRRVGYLAAIVVDGLLLLALNVWPGWSVVPFLTDGMTLVLPVMNLSLVAGMVANAAYLVNDGRLVRSLGDLVTTAIAVVVLVRLWHVYPFDVSSTWDAVLRVGLAVVTVGCAIGCLVSFVRLVGALFGLGDGSSTRR